MIRYIIVDDEPIAHKIIESFAKDMANMELKQNCYNAMEAMEYLNSNTVHLMFLDINMPKIRGLDFLKLLKNPPAVIITSAYEGYALEGYELNVVDYLLKPFSFERFMQAVYKITDNKPILSIQEASTKTEAKSMFIKGDKKYHQINLNQVLYIESLGSYCKVNLISESIVTHEKISNFEVKLQKDDFIRVHKSYIVSKKHIKEIEGNRISIGKNQIPIGQTYKMNLKKILNI